MKILFFLIIYPVYFYSFCQLNFSERIVNEQGKGIPFAHITFKDKSNGTISDKNGYFDLKCSKLDTIIITAIGYKTKFIPALLIAKNSLILIEEITKLDEVVISSERKKVKIIHLGNTDKKLTGQFGSCQEVALFIENTIGYPVHIHQLQYHISRVRFNSSNSKKHLLKNKELLVRAKIYSVQTNNNKSGIGKDLLLVSKSLRIGEKQKKIFFDISEENIYLPKEGVFVSLELLGIYEEDVFIPVNQLSKEDLRQFNPVLSNRHSYANTYVRWRLGGDLEFFNQPSFPNYSNANFGIVVEK